MENKKRETIDTYNKSARSIANKFNRQGARTEDINRLFSFIKKKDPFVLEIGCGNGNEAKEILKRTKNYLGIDVSKNLIKIAREDIPEGKFEVADIEDYRFPKNIDAVVSFASLLHSNKENISKILKRVHEVLSDGGVFYISLKKGEYSEEGFTRTDEFGTRTYFFYTPELIQELAGNSYEVIYTNERNLRGQEWFVIVMKKTQGND